VNVVPPNEAVDANNGPGQSVGPALPPPSLEIPDDAAVAVLRAALVNLSAIQGRQAKELKDQARALETAKAKIDALTADLSALKALAEKYRPAVEKFVNGPGRLFLKV
jgi:hypothetical protein